MNIFIATIEQYFFTIIGGILSIAFVGFVAFRNNRLNNLADARTQLQVAFGDELSIIKHPPRDISLEIVEILESAFQKHHTSVLNFNRLLSKRKSIKFMEAWRTYHAHGKHGEKPYFSQYASTAFSLHNKEPRLVAIERIEKILSIT
ncbi:MAG: hypothetical protein OEV42_15635 [Deltaproteobacteria bacterium]|nr:hypothetical protein [Deltaproteobacteria bacterium]